MIVDTSAVLAISLLQPMASTRIAVQPVSLGRTRSARLACAEFGQGRHPAGLNVGDCFACALGKESGLPLLFKGDEFARTGIEPAVRNRASPIGNKPHGGSSS